MKSIALTTLLACLAQLSTADYNLKINAPANLKAGDQFTVSWEFTEEANTGLVKIPEKMDFILWNSPKHKPCCGGPVQGAAVLASGVSTNNGQGQYKLTIPDSLELPQGETVLFVKAAGFENGKGKGQPYRGFISNQVSVEPAKPASPQPQPPKAEPDNKPQEPANANAKTPEEKKPEDGKVDNKAQKPAVAASASSTALPTANVSSSASKSAADTKPSGSDNSGAGAFAAVSALTFCVSLVASASLMS
jgi:hypothetical protein